MNTKEVIEFLGSFKEVVTSIDIENGDGKAIEEYNDKIDEAINLLKRGEAYEAMWEKLKKIHGDGCITTYYVDVGKGKTKKELYATRLRKFMDEWEKYFPGEELCL